MPTEIRTSDELVALLGTLGSTADEIADKLEKLGIRGVPGEPSGCPIANWLKAEVADTYDVDVQNETVVVNEGVECATPSAVEGFIVRFDDRRYLALIDRFGAGAFPALIQEG